MYNLLLYIPHVFVVQTRFLPGEYHSAFNSSTFSNVHTARLATAAPDSGKKSSTLSFQEMAGGVSQPKVAGSKDGTVAV